MDQNFWWTDKMIKLIATQAELKEEINKAGDKLVVLDFFATWCGPCKRMGPIMEGISEQFKDVVFLKVDVDENIESSTKYDITCMPTFVFVKRKAVVERFSGSATDKIVATINKLC